MSSPPKLNSFVTAAQVIPVLLLKTKSSPGDSYEELLLKSDECCRFAPRFVPVLSHRFDQRGIEKVRTLLRERRIGHTKDASFGGMIFTSQRAVDAFTDVINEGRDRGVAQWPHLQNIPIYSVGPATTRTLRAIAQEPPLQVFGEHTGNGEALAQFILEHYQAWHRDGSPSKLPSLLFLVGEQRRDIIPRLLMASDLPNDQRIDVIEEVVYGTGLMDSFPADLETDLRETSSSSSRWIVVFSPAGCGSMLRGLGLLDETTGKALPHARDGTTFIATIGPTTRDYLIRTFDFEPDVCAETPSPEGVLQGIMHYESSRRSYDFTS